MRKWLHVGVEQILKLLNQEVLLLGLSDHLANNEFSAKIYRNSTTKALLFERGLKSIIFRKHQLLQWAASKMAPS